MKLYAGEEDHLHARREVRLAERDRLIDIFEGYSKRLDALMSADNDIPLRNMMERFQAEFKYDAEAWKKGK